MCSFLGKGRIHFWCLTVRNRKIVLGTLSLFIMLNMALTATAFYFDFQYFETDKLVYEVGESVDMVARLIADFSQEGWCFVSFAAVTDLGPTFADEYFITASPNPRMLTSSYTILPDDTNPGENGTTANILFNVEIFDTVSQGAGENIEITINRGHLTVNAITPLIVQSDDNVSLVAKIVSIHNSTIPYSTQPINVYLENPSNEPVLDFNTTTNQDGTFSFDWNSSMGLPGDYDLIVTGNGNEDFLEFSKHLPVTVVPTSSNLTITQAPSFTYCQSPDGSSFEEVNITVRHEAADYSGITDSIIFWDTDFASGTMNHIDDGYYSTIIPFHTSPGICQINITSTNPRYQTDTQLISIETKPNILYFNPVQTNISVIQGNFASIDFVIEEEIDWNQTIALEFLDTQGEITLHKDVIPNISTALTITAWYNLSIGPHNITLVSLSEYYEFSGLDNFQFNVFGELVTNAFTETAFYGESIQLNLSVFDNNNVIVNPVSIRVFYNNELVPFTTIDQASPLQLITIPIPLRIQVGQHLFRYEIIAPYFVHSMLEENVTILMRTNITIIIESSHSNSIYHSDILASISLGSIIRPPPILFSGTTVVLSLTTRDTSLDNCPRFISGTKILSTDLLNSLTA